MRIVLTAAYRAFSSVVAYLGSIAQHVGVAPVAPRSLYEPRRREEDHRP